MMLDSTYKVSMYQKLTITEKRPIKPDTTKKPAEIKPIIFSTKNPL